MTFAPQLPVNLTSKHFSENQHNYYQWLRQEAPVCKGKMLWVNNYLVSNYEDCNFVLKDPRFVRNRTTATGGSRLPFPMPKSLKLLSSSMITDDDPTHRRLKNLVHQAFLPRSVERLGSHLEAYADSLLDQAEPQGEVDLITAYSNPIPMEAISRMLGVSESDTYQLKAGMQVLSKGFSGLRIIHGMFWGLPKMVNFTR